MDHRPIDPSGGDDDLQFDNTLRPQSLAEMLGQEKTKQQLGIAIEAARQRGEAMDHVLLYGPPGLGKTTLSHVIAKELGVEIYPTSGPLLDRPGDLAGMLTTMAPRDVLFIDEMHRVNRVVEEYLYSAMEDFKIDIIIDQGPAARSVSVPLEPFTLVGATTRQGLLTSPMRARFGLTAHLDYYSVAELAEIVKRDARLLNFIGLRVGRDGNCPSLPWHGADCQALAAPCARFCPSGRRRRDRCRGGAKGHSSSKMSTRWGLIKWISRCCEPLLKNLTAARSA